MVLLLYNCEQNNQLTPIEYFVVYFLSIIVSEFKGNVYITIIFGKFGIKGMIKTLITALRLLWIASTDRILKIRLIGSYLFGVVQGVIAFCSPLVLAEMIKQISQKDISATLFYFYLTVVLAALLIVSRYIWRYACEVITRILPINLQWIYYRKIFDKPYDWHLQNSVGYFSTALNNVCSMLQNWLWKMPYDYVGSLVTAICFLVYTWVLSFRLFMYFLVSLVIMVWIIRILYNRRIKYIEAYSRSSVGYGKNFIDFLYNVRSVKKMNLLAFVKKKLDEKGQKVIATGTEMMHYNATQYGFTELFIHVQFLLPVGWYVYRFIETGEGIEIIVMIASIQNRFAELGRQLMGMMTELARTQSDYKILAEHLGEDFSTEVVRKAPKKWNRICFEKSVFKFVKDGSVFCHKVDNFTINRGDHIAVVGKSGEGKTTFLNLLTNQFAVAEGRVTVDGIDYKELSPAFFDNNITYISQDVELFDMTLYDNIVMGKRITEENLQKIIDGCCLNELVERMNGNLHTDIGEKGVKVSAGEKQRIALARGLLLGRQILVLDEITANLDPATTAQIWKFIFEEYADRTIVAVSHEKELLNHVGRRLEFKKGIGKEI